MRQLKTSKKIRKYLVIFVLSSLLFSIVSIGFLSYFNYPSSIQLSLFTLLLTGITIIIYMFYKQKGKYFILLVTFSLFVFSSSIGCIYYSATYQESYYHGIDISKWDGNVSLKDTTLDFVILRCGYTSNVDGITIKPDSQFEQNIKQCKELGIPYGIYYYSCATDTTQASKEANYTLSVLKDDIPPLGIYYDTEDPTYQEPLSKEELTTIALSFLEVIEDAGIKAGVYANYYWWNNKLDHDRLDDYLKWVAIYDDEYVIEDMYAIHQYSDSGTIKGIKGEFDVNVTTDMYWLDE